MWLLKGPWWRNLILGTMLALCRQADGKLYLISEDKMSTAAHLHLSAHFFLAAQFRWHLRNCSHFWPWIQTTMNVPQTRLRPTHVYWAAFIQLTRGTQESLLQSGTYWHNVWECVTGTICLLCVTFMFMSQQMPLLFKWASRVALNAINNGLLDT